MIEIKFTFIIKDKFKEIRDKEINEQLVLNIINKSKVIFKEKKPFKRIDNNKQANGEPDFISQNYELDCKLFLPRKFLKEMSVKNIIPYNTLEKYINNFYKEIINNNISYKNKNDYSDLKSSIRKGNKKNIILLYPFPILKIKDSIAAIISQTLFEKMIYEVVKEEKIKNDIYLLTYTYENLFYLKNIKDNMIEFINCNHFKNKYARIEELKSTKI